MKKILILSCALFLFASSGRAQSKWFSGFNLGTAIPVGDFGSLDFNNEKSGFANVGLVGDLHAGYQITNNFGLMGLVRFRINGVDEKALSGFYTLPTGSGGSLSVNTTTYTMGSLLLGVYESVALNREETFFFDLRAMGGLQATKLPEINATASIPGTIAYNSTQEAISEYSFAYLFGAAFKYKLNDNLSLKLSGDYNASKPKFKINNGGTTQSYTQPTNTIDVGVGLVFGF